jgi:hypothetical protein
LDTVINAHLPQVFFDDDASDCASGTQIFVFQEFARGLDFPIKKVRLDQLPNLKKRRFKALSCGFQNCQLDFEFGNPSALIDNNVTASRPLKPYQIIGDDIVGEADFFPNSRHLILRFKIVKAIRENLLN